MMSIVQVVPSLCMLWSMPLQICLAVYFLWLELGLAVLGGVALLAALVPFNTAMGRRAQAVSKQQLGAKDARLAQLYEFLNAVKLIKLYAWENLFQTRVEESREAEVKFLRKNAVIKAVINFVFSAAPLLVTLVSFGLYVMLDLDHQLTPEKVGGGSTKA